ncbi:MAG: ATP-binding protein [Dehalococcoidales bacterium]|nr:ATP-binding protein [Dehalococcoidales bacterium]
MSVYVLIPIIVFAFCIGLLILLITSGLRHAARRPFLVFLIFMTLWAFFIFLMRSSISLESAYRWEIWVLISILSVAQFFYRFTLSFTNTKERKLILYTIYFLYFLSIALIPAGLVAKGMQAMWYGKAPIIGPLFIIYLVAAYAPIALALRVLLTHYKRTKVISEKVRDSYLILGVSFMLIGATTDFLPALGIPLYPLGIIGNLLFCIVATVSMLRYGLLEIQVVLRKGTAYALVSLVMLSIVIGAFLLVTRFSQELSTPAFVVILIIAFLAIAVIFQPIQSRVQRAVDRWFFRGRYDHLLGLELFTRETKNIVDLKQLSESLLSMIGQGMESKRVYLLLPSSQSGDFETYSSFGEDQKNEHTISFPANSLLTQAMKYQDNAIDINDIDYIPSLSSINVEDRKTLTDNDIALLVPLRSKDLLTGILLLRNKTSGDSYSAEDRQLLRTISNQAAVSIENARLYDQLQKQLIRSSKLAALGELATNVAHEVNNSLQSVINYGTILYEDLGEDNPLREEAKVIETEAIRARNIVEILLGIARKERTTREIIDLNDVIKTIVTLARLRTKSENIIINENYSLEAPLVKASAEQLRQVLLNLFTNATDAMPKGGTIDVATIIENGKVVCTVADTGTGIPPDTISKIFDSLYTTKVNGTGLGLTVSKTIVEEHGGTIEVESEGNHGTKFTIKLPKI